MISVQDAALLSLKAYDFNGAITNQSTGFGATLGSYVPLNTQTFVEAYGDASVSANFGAMAYSNGQEIVIAYTGTDAFWQDAPDGYGTGTGATTSPQAELALAFYQAVKDANPNAQVVLTGHSLGGGLAGYVAGLYGETAVLFDNMDYDTAVQNAYNDVAMYNTWEADVALNGEDSPYYTLYMGETEYYTNLRDRIYGTDSAFQPDLSGISAYSVQGEFLELNRSNVSTILSLGDDVALNPFSELHNLSLLNIRYFMSINSLPEQVSEVGKYIFPTLFDESIAQSVGYANSEELLSSLAYSISSGGLPVSAFSDDAQDVGSASAAGLGAAADAGNSWAEIVLRELAQASVQYAGYLAHSNASGIDPVGVLTFNAGEQSVTIDYSSVTWSAFGQQPTELAGRTELMDAATRNDLDFAIIEDFSGHLRHYLEAEPVDVIGKATIATGAASGPITLPSSELTDYQMFIGSQVADHVIGSEESDLLFAGRADDGGLPMDSNPDILEGGSGADMLVGSFGAATLIGGEGSDYIIGGAANDTIHGGRPTTEDDGPFIDEIMGAEYVPFTVDSEADVIAAGAGDDTVYISGAQDIVSLGDGEDDIYIERSPEQSDQMSLIWGGEGADSYYFNTTCSVLFAYCDDLTEDMLLGVDLWNLNNAISNYFNVDYVIINSDSADRLYVGDEEIESASIYSSSFDRHLEDFFEYESSDEYYESQQIYVPTEVLYTDSVETRNWYTHTGEETGLDMNPSTYSVGVIDPNDPVQFGSEYLNRVDIDYPGHESSVDFFGFTDGTAGIEFADSTHQEQVDINFSYYGISVTGWEYLTETSSGWEAQNVTYNTTGLISSEVERLESEAMTLPDDFNSGGQVSLDLSRFLKTYDSDDGDAASGGDGPDTYYGGGGADIYYGGAGDDEAQGGSGDDELHGEEGDDYLVGGSGNDSLYGESDNDGLVGDVGNDHLLGGSGNDWLDGGAGNDEIDGGEGDDEVDYYGGLSDFTFKRNPDYSVTVTSSAWGIDTLENVESLWLYAPDGSDYTVYALSDLVPEVPEILGTSGADTLTGTDDDEMIHGLDDADTLFGQAGDDGLFGGDGDDVFFPGEGSNFVDGGSGSDTVIVDGSASDFTLTLLEDKSIRVEGQDIANVVSNVEWIVFDAPDGEDDLSIDVAQFVETATPSTIEGTSGDDTLTGTAGSDTVNGYAGADTIFGLGQDDVIIGGDGNDVIFPGAGNNTVDGGDGSDTIIIDGARSAFTVTVLEDNSIQVLGGDVSNVISDAEWIVFDAPEGEDDVSIDVAQLISDNVSTSAASSFASINSETFATGYEEPGANEQSSDEELDVAVGSSSLSTLERLLQGAIGGDITPLSAADTGITNDAIQQLGNTAANVINFSDFLNDLEEENGDLWFEPEPIGAFV